MGCIVSGIRFRRAGYPRMHLRNREKEDKTLATDRRKSPRYRVDEGAIIIYDQRTDQEIGVVIDISLKGLAFEYFDVGASIPKEGEINLLVWDFDFYIRKIPYRIVSNFGLKTKEHSPIPISRCSVRFENMSIEKNGKFKPLSTSFPVKWISPPE